MADEADIRFLGEQLKRLQGDVRQVKSDMAQMHADNVKVEGDVAGLKADLTRLDGSLDAFRESVDDQFGQVIELLKSNFLIVANEINSLKRS